MLILVLQPASAEEFSIDPQKSEIKFTIGHFAGTEDGKFNKFSGSLDFDEENPERSKVSVVIDVASIDTRNRKRNAHLQKSDYFDAKLYPTITFESRAFKKRGDHYVVTGPLTMRGVEKNITLQVKLVRRVAQWAVEGDALTFRSEHELNRFDFGVSGGRPVVGKTVKIEMDIRAIQSKN